MIGNDKDGGLEREPIDDLTSRGVEALVNLADRIAKLRRQLWIMDEMILIHVLPEVVLDCVDRHEDEHHHVLRMVLEQIERGLCPLLIHLLHFGEHLIPPLVGRHRAEESEIELDSTEVLDQFLPQSRRMNKRAALGRRIHSGDLESIQRLGRISEWNVHRADGVAGVVQELPDGGRAARCRVRVIHRVAAMLGLDEMKDAVLAGVLARHERRPGRRSDRRENGLERARNAGLHQLRQIRHAAFRHPRPDESPRRGVQADDHYLWNLLHRGEEVSCPAGWRKVVTGNR